MSDRQSPDPADAPPRAEPAGASAPGTPTDAPPRPEPAGASAPGTPTGAPPAPDRAVAEPVTVLRPFDPRRPFTRQQALAAGLTDNALRGKRYRNLLTGVYLLAEVPAHPLHRVQAALLIHPPMAFASHVSAGRVHRVPLSDHAGDEHVTVFDKNDRRRRPGIRTHVIVGVAEVAVVDGVRVSSYVQMFVELGECLNLVELVVVGDWLVRWKGITPEELVDYCARSTLPGAAAARKAAGYVRREVDSPMETRLRMLLVLAGLPEPKVNHKIYDALGVLLYRFDLAYPDLLIALEYDGRQHRDDLDQWDHDTVKRDWCERNGWAQVPVFSRGIFRHPDKTIARVAEKLTERGVRLPRLSDEWRRYFPVKR